MAQPRKKGRVSSTKSSRQRRLLLTLILCVLLITFGSILARVGYEHWRTFGIDEIPYQYRVVPTSNVGFALGTGDLAFGKVTFGGGGTRTVRFASSRPLIAVFDVDDVRIAATPNPARLTPDAPMIVSFNLEVPLTADVGNYTGIIRVTYLRPLPWE